VQRRSVEDESIEPTQFEKGCIMHRNAPIVELCKTTIGSGVLACCLIPAAVLAQPSVHIYDIQGAGHISPFAGEQVTTKGIVTAVTFDGYYVQDPTGDGNDLTSDGMFVFDTRSSKPIVGDEVQMTDFVAEFIPGGAATGNLSITEFSFPQLTVLSSGNPVPDPVSIGRSGRMPPNEIVISETELPTNLQDDPGVFNPDVDGIDFYESLEGMLVKIEDPVAVSAIRSFGRFSSEFFALADNGMDVAPPNARTGRGGIFLQPDPDNRGDQNPERVQVQFDASVGQVGTLYPGEAPIVKVGDRLSDVTGVVGYRFGNFEVNATEIVSVEAPSGITPERTELEGDKHKLTIASYNVLNLSPLPADDNQRATLARQIVNHLDAPDIIALQEIQDNDGEADTGETDATETLLALRQAVIAAGGPTYLFFDVAPADGSSGGVPGGNIRNAYFYNPDRVALLEFKSLTPDGLASMGVSDPTAFEGTRSPLMAEFKFRGQKVNVINNHLTSRFGSSPIFGGPQPFVQAGENEREAQTTALNEVVNYLIPGKRGNRNIIVLGDLNTFEFTNDLTELLPGAGKQQLLSNLIPTAEDAYTFIFDGNSQALDHVFVSRGLVRRAELDVVHVNVDFPRVDDTVGSDHEPLLLLLNFGSPNQ
jgi:predicted extracellular nuclease